MGNEQLVHERFMAKVDRRPDGCWVWTACRVWNGYGQFRVAGKTVYAHRFAYELLVGPIPDGLELDHLCRNRACVNPSHLEVVDSRTNTLRGDGPAAQNARKTHCAHGHELTLENIWRSGRNSRLCRACSLDRQRSTRKKVSA